MSSKVVIVLGWRRSLPGDLLWLVAGYPAELLNPLGNLPGVMVLVLRVILKVGLHPRAMDIRGHKVVVPVLEERSPLAGLRPSQQGDDLVDVGLIGWGVRAVGKVLLGVLVHLVQAVLPDRLSLGAGLRFPTLVALHRVRHGSPHVIGELPAPLES